jgi:hypothetical protein
MNTDSTRTDHQALTAARAAARAEEDKRFHAAMTEYACTLGAMLSDSERAAFYPATNRINGRATVRLYGKA